MAQPFYGVLVDKQTGAEIPFSDRSEYLSAFYAGGVREKKLDEPEQAPAQEQQPAPQPRRRSWREPVNDEPVVETAPNE